MVLLQRGRMAIKREAAKSERSLLTAEKLGLTKWFVPRCEVQLDQKIGTGAFGAAYKCRRKGQDVKMVAKVIKVTQLSESDAERFQNEVKIWAELQHPACVKFLGVCLGRDEHLLLGVFCPGGSLNAHHARCRKEKRLPIDAATFMAQAKAVAGGMTYLHEMQIIHRDLKSHNILINASGGLQISDFGVARLLPSIEVQELTAETGSYRWMAPEVMRHEPYNKSCDVWSFGMLCVEMLTYKVPFAEMGSPVQVAFAVAIGDERPTLPVACEPDVVAMMRKCWSAQPEQRPTFSQILRELDNIPVGAAHIDGSDAELEPSLACSLRSSTQAMRLEDSPVKQEKGPPSPSRLRSWSGMLRLTSSQRSRSHRASSGRSTSERSEEGVPSSMPPKGK